MDGPNPWPTLRDGWTVSLSNMHLWRFTRYTQNLPSLRRISGIQQSAGNLPSMTEIKHLLATKDGLCLQFWRKKHYGDFDNTVNIILALQISKQKTAHDNNEDVDDHDACSSLKSMTQMFVSNWKRTWTVMPDPEGWDGGCIPHRRGILAILRLLIYLYGFVLPLDVGRRWRVDRCKDVMCSPIFH